MDLFSISRVFSVGVGVGVLSVLKKYWIVSKQAAGATNNNHSIMSKYELSILGIDFSSSLATQGNGFSNDNWVQTK